MDKNVTLQASSKQENAKKTKAVRNRSGHKIELIINEKVVVFLPGKVVNVPVDFNIPNGLGLYVK